MAWLLRVNPSHHWDRLWPDLAIGVCQRTGDALGKPAMKESGGKWLYFFSQLYCTHNFSRRSAPRGTADVNKTEGVSEFR